MVQISNETYSRLLNDLTAHIQIFYPDVIAIAQEDKIFVKHKKFPQLKIVVFLFTKELHNKYKKLYSVSYVFNGLSSKHFLDCNELNHAIQDIVESNDFYHMMKNLTTVKYLFEVKENGTTYLSTHDYESKDTRKVTVFDVNFEQLYTLLESENLPNVLLLKMLYSLAKDYSMQEQVKKIIFDTLAQGT